MASPPLVNSSELKQFFADIGSRLEQSQPEVAQVQPRLTMTQAELEEFFSAVGHQVEEQRRLDKRQATGFNVFHLIEPDENKLSDILAGLLDPKGDHGQGDLFLRLLFKQLARDSDAGLTKNAKVQREAPTHGIQKYRRRMDVLVEAGVLLAIENKLDSLEQSDQVKDYLEHLRQCERPYSKPNCLIYLTPDGRPPVSLKPAEITTHQADGRLCCWSYPKELRKWLEACHQGCEAPRIRDFLSDFIAYIESALKREAESNQQEHDDEA